jgi:broad specificity phosphatase PhoE
VIIHFVRHCESIWNQDSKYAGHTNVPLSIEGKHQSHRLANKIKTFSINYILSSDLDRAVHTALPISKELGIPLSIEKGLREVNFGSFEGLNQSDIAKKFPKIWDSYLSNPKTFKFPEGETIIESLERSLDVLLKLLYQPVQQQSIIVMHGTLIRVILSAALGIDLNNFRSSLSPLANGSITSVKFPLITNKDNFYGAGSLVSYNQVIF